MKSTTVAIALSLLFVSSMTYAASNDLTDEKRTDIQLFLDMIDQGELVRKISEQVVNQIRSDEENRPPEYFDALREEIDKILEKYTREFEPHMIAMYHKHFTHEDIKEMLRIFGTPVGQKYIRLQPQLSQEFMREYLKLMNKMQPEMKATFKRLDAEFDK